jgi:hypothetical protein
MQVFATAQEQNLCNKFTCTTCGAMPLRNELIIQAKEQMGWGRSQLQLPLDVPSDIDRHLHTALTVEIIKGLRSLKEIDLAQADSEWVHQRGLDAGDHNSASVSGRPRWEQDLAIILREIGLGPGAPRLCCTSELRWVAAALSGAWVGDYLAEKSFEMGDPAECAFHGQEIEAQPGFQPNPQQGLTACNPTEVATMDT